MKIRFFRKKATNKNKKLKFKELILVLPEYPKIDNLVYYNEKQKMLKIPKIKGHPCFQKMKK